MAVYEIPMNKWTEFFEQMNQQPQGWQVSLYSGDMVPEVGDIILGTEMGTPLLEDVVLQEVDWAADNLLLSLATDEGHRDYVLEGPRRMVIDDAGNVGERSIRVLNASGKFMVIHLKAVAHPERINPTH